MNEQKLKEMGVGADTIKQLYLSKGFTLTLHTAARANLREVNVPGCADYVATAAEADAEREALFFAESAEHARALPQDDARRDGPDRLAGARREDEGRPRRGAPPGRLGALDRGLREGAHRGREAAPRRSSAPRSSRCG